MLDRIRASGVRSNMSIKLSQIGLLLDAGLCQDNLQRILQKARQTQNFIRIDMEDSSLTEKTLACLRWARTKGFENVGIVLQSYLHRSQNDIQELIAEGVPVRLVKGAYREPAEIAYPDKADVDQAFDRLAGLLIAGAKQHANPTANENGLVPPIPAIATHDPKRIQTARDLQVQYGLPKQAIEFQMLYGIRRDLQEALVGAGFPVRVYVPYGTHWYPYFMRRLAERPANMWFFISNFFRR